MKQKIRYELLDFLRGLAAIGVMLFHFSIIGLPIAPHGYLAVDLFFVLSGFVMSHAYCDRLDKMSFLDFLKIRVIRIMPLSVFGLLVGSSYFVLRYFLQINSQYEFKDIISGTIFNIFLLPKPWISPAPTDTIFTSNTPLWSLSLEFFVNFIWALFLFRSKMSIIYLIVIISFAGVAITSFTNGSADIGATWPTYLGGVARAVFGFFVGIILWHNRPSPNKTLLYPFIAIVLLSVTIFSPDLGPSFDVLAIALFFPLIIYLASCADFRVERPFFKFIGNLSYPLYVIHVPILHFLVGISKIIKIEEGKYILALFAFISCIAAAGVLDFLYDRPVRRIFTRYLVS